MVRSILFGVNKKNHLPEWFNIKLKRKLTNEGGFHEKTRSYSFSSCCFFRHNKLANASTAMLNTGDFVGISFWLVSMGMIATTVFFFAERGTVAASWRTSISVAGLVTGVAFVHYMYMREVWVTTGDTPTVYRYIDWLITVPLQMVEFYLILAAVRKVPSSIF